MWEEKENSCDMVANDMAASDEKKHARDTSQTTTSQDARQKALKELEDLEKLYLSKEEMIRETSENLDRIQRKLYECEHETLNLLRRLMPLQNRILLETIETQKAQIRELLVYNEKKSH